MYPGQDPYQQPDPYQPYSAPPSDPYATGPAEYSISPPAPAYPQSPPAYPPTGYSVPPLAQPVQGGTNVFGILSLIFGIISIPLDFCCYIGVPFGIAAIVLGVIGVVRANSDGNFALGQGRSATGKGMAIGGIACGAAGVVLMVVVFFVGFGIQTFGN